MSRADSLFYENYSRNASLKHVYPVEFVVRVFLGSYPGLKMEKRDYTGERVLDLGFGDGRNFPLLRNLGFSIAGVEVSQPIVDLARRKFEKLGIPADLRVGRSSKLPFDSASFDCVLACHSMYYVDEGERFSDNLSEIARVLKPGALLIASLPKPTNHVNRTSDALDDGHFRITRDPLGIRDGSIFRVFESSAEIENVFSNDFENFSFGSCEDDYFGIQQDVWLVVCRKRKTKGFSSQYKTRERE